VRDANRRWRTARRVRRAVLVLALAGVTTGAGLATAGFALAAGGSQPGSLILSPASGATTLRPTWSTSDGCPAGHQQSAEMSEFNTNGTLASRISPVVNGNVTGAFSGTLDGNIGELLHVTDIKNGGTIEFAIGCYSLVGGTGSVEFVQSAQLTLSSAGTSYTARASGSAVDGSFTSTSDTGTEAEAAVIAGACGLVVAIAGIAWYRRRNRSRLM
jgi:hypothetical protein